MSSKATEPRSIASQLVLLFTPAAAVLLCCGIGILYWIVIRHAFAEDRAVLAEKVFALRADLKAAGGPTLVRAQLKTLRAGERSAYWVRVVDANGQTVAETPGMATLLPPAVFASQRNRAPDQWGEEDLRLAGRLFSLVATSAAANGKAYALQVAQDRTTDEQFEHRFGFLVAAVLVGGVFASALLAVTVTKRGLQPLATMTRSLRRVAPDHLHERVPPHEWPRELQPVAIAFDGMLDRLEDSFNRLSQFSADLAHELRTPLAHIRGEAEVALTRPRSPEEYQAVIESSVVECERLSGMIDNLLFLARAEAAESQVRRETFDARAAAEKIVAYYEAVAEDRQVQLAAEGAGEISADPLLFSRVLSNLVENALRFTPEGGAITISIAPNETATKVEVRDTGAGIGGEHLPRVFDRFYRADSSRASEGTGLGLALVKSIAELHGGTAALASEVGCGTSVTLTFPHPANPST